MPLKSHLLSGNEFSGCKGTAFFSFRQIFSPVFCENIRPFRKKALDVVLNKSDVYCHNFYDDFFNKVSLLAVTC